MFIVISTYLKDLKDVDLHLPAHRDYLKSGYDKNYFLLSGPQHPRIGGVIISHLKDREILENFLAQDPFYLAGIATYQILEFNPVQSHSNLSFLKHGEH